MERLDIHIYFGWIRTKIKLNGEQMGLDHGGNENEKNIAIKYCKPTSWFSCLKNKLKGWTHTNIAPFLFCQALFVYFTCQWKTAVYFSRIKC